MSEVNDCLKLIFNSSCHEFSQKGYVKLTANYESKL
jgi:hypothetical protein